MATETLVEALRSRGLRLTAQRELVLGAVRRLGHATPEQVHSVVTQTAAGINITTVYRTLELLEELGLVTHTHLTHGATTFHAVGQAEHAHLVCRSCDTVYEVPVDLLGPLAEQLDVDRGFAVDVTHVALFGVCERCRAAAGSAPDADDTGSDAPDAGSGPHADARIGPTADGPLE